MDISDLPQTDSSSSLQNRRRPYHAALQIPPSGLLLLLFSLPPLPPSICVWIRYPPSFLASLHDAGRSEHFCSAGRERGHPKDDYCPRRRDHFASGVITNYFGEPLDSWKFNPLSAPLPSHPFSLTTSRKGQANWTPIGHGRFFYSQKA